MKHLSKAITALFLALLMGTLLPVQVFADTPDYISEIKIYEGSYASAEEEGYTILKEGNKAINLNQSAGATGIGSRGEKAVYFGYKTTKESSEAITDLALMNMKGGYSIEDYDSLMESNLKDMIIPFVDSFLAAIKEYRENYNSSNAAKKQRAAYIHDALNKLTDDDCGGAGLGDLLLNKTKYEMGDDAYNALSDEEKKEHADILTIIAQSNGNATLMLENLLTRAADTNEDTWVDRFAAMTYDELVDETGLSPSKAAKQLAKQYDDDATLILQIWDAFREELLNADTAKEKLENTDVNEIEECSEVLNDFSFETADDNDRHELAEATVKTEVDTELMANRINDICNKEYLSSIEYEDGTLYDFFTKPSEEIEEDITVLYPLVAAFSDGQRAGLEFVTLSTLVSIAGTKDKDYSDEFIDEIKEVSIYEGVERAVYEKGGVALTSEAFREKAKLLEASQKKSDFPFNWWTLLSAGTALACASAFFVSMGVRIYSKSMITKLQAAIETSSARLETFNTTARKTILDLAKKLDVKNGDANYTWAQYHKDCNQINLDREALRQTIAQDNAATNQSIERLSARSATCSKLMIGFGIAMIIIIGITIYFTYTDMVNRYKVSYTPIPKFMIDEKDLIGYNSRGERIVLKNQAAYYRAVLCNRSKGAEFYNSLGNVADLNGCVGQQWLALYTEKDEKKSPILASSLKAVTHSDEIPAGYTTGIHMFGTDAAENLNNPLYVWNSSAPKVFVYFKTEDMNASALASNFTVGTLALSGAAGIAFGAAITALATKASGKRRENEVQAA